MGEINNEPLTGAAWATHHVTVWLENDRPLAEWAKTLAAGDEFEYGDNALHEWADQLLYDPKGRQWLADVSADMNAARNVRDSFTREDFDAIDWTAVRASLLAE